MAKILIVDDDRHTRIIVARNLQNNGHTPIEAVSGKEVIQMLKKDDNGVDLILLDQLMPDMDGLETLEIINEEKLNHPPVILITAYNSIPLSVAFIKAGAVDYLEKPIDKDLMEAKIQKYVTSATAK